MAQPTSDKRLYRSGNACMGGICDCIAKRFDVDPIVVRILAVILACVTFGFAAIVYLVMWAVLPRDPQDGRPYDVRPERAESSAYGALDVKGGPSKPAGEAVTGYSLISRLAVAVCLMLLFLGVALTVEPIVDGSHWWQFWPVGFIIAGLCLIVIPVNGKHEMVWHVAGVAVASCAAAMLPVSLGILSPSSFSVAAQRMWPVLVASVLCMAAGFVKGNNSLLVVSALLLAAFFLMAIAFYGMPGDVEQLMLNMPGGGSMRIAMLPAVSA